MQYHDFKNPEPYKTNFHITDIIDGESFNKGRPWWKIIVQTGSRGSGAGGSKTLSFKNGEEFTLSINDKDWEAVNDDRNIIDNVYWENEKDGSPIKFVNNKDHLVMKLSFSSANWKIHFVKKIRTARAKYN